MKYIDEFRDPALIHQAAREIAALAPARTLRLMEVCGGHTHSIHRFGLQQFLPPSIELVHGPGCPVCVLPMSRVDDGLELSAQPGVILTAFGDMMRVPGHGGSLLERKARGADVRMVYSPLDALKLARDNPERQVVFFAIGFETTTPSTALTLLRARAEGVSNFSVFCNHIVLPPALRAVLDSPDMRVDGFIGPGHVSTVIGIHPYDFIASEYGRPVVVSGFEPLDILQSVVLLLRQFRDGQAQVVNNYARVVPDHGNPAAIRAMAEVFELRETFEWRGMGYIPASALALREEFADWDAERRFNVRPVSGLTAEAHAQARCGDVLRGALKPTGCPLYGNVCTPERPVGALMVSSEGACAAYHQYQPASLTAVSAD